MVSRIRRNPALVVGVAASALVLVAACGSSGSSSPSSQASSPAATSSTPVATSSASVSPSVAALDQIVSKYSADPTSLGVTQPLSRRPPKGLTIVNAIPGAPVGAVMAVGIKQAATAFGWHVDAVNMGGTAQTITAAWNQIANMSPPPTAVIEEGVDPALFQSQLKTLTAHKVPVVAVSVPKYPLITGASSGIIANIQDPSFQVLNGKVLADYEIAKSAGKANNLFVWAPDYNFYDPFVAAYKKEFAVCAPGCSVATLPISGTAIGTTAPAQIVSYLRAHPDINQVTGAFGDILIGLPTALQQAGLAGKVTLYSTGGGSTTLQYIKSGQQAMTLGIPLIFLGYSAMDIIARHIVGDSLSADDHPLPIQYLTSSQLNFNIKTQQWPGVQGFAAKFAKLWGLG